MTGADESHTVCVPQDDSDDMWCNGFGKYNQFNHECVCEQDYAGRFCEMCEDPDFEYPDCTGEFEAAYMDSLAFDSFQDRRRERVYHRDYHLEAAMSPF